jgi:tRNA(Arg) A34 adenosine deaminase TadA
MTKNSKNLSSLKNKTHNLKTYFEAALSEASKGSRAKHGGPFGAVVIRNGKIIAKAHNTVIRDNDPTCHAEVNAIRKACKKLKRFHIEDCILIASSEPCPMCLTTSYWAQVKEIHYALPRSIAAKVGFADDYIYKDISKKPLNRTIPVIHYKELEKEGLKIFNDWQNKNGKLY